MKTRKIGNYLTNKYQKKFEFRYTFRDYLDNFRSQYLQIHWGDNAWSYPVIANPKNRPELKFTGLVQDTTFGPYTELGCFFVSSEEYDELKQKRDRFPEFLYNYFWPAYRKEEFPALYIHSGLSEELFLKRKQNTLQAYQEYLK